MKKIKEQIVVAFDNREDFVKDVQKHLDKGWEIKDPVSICNKTTLYVCAYTQTMVKYED